MGLQITKEKQDIFIISFFLITSSTVIFHNLGGSLAPWDEAIYAEVAREIYYFSDWITLHWNYQEWFLKPPLYIWLTAIVYKIIGTNEISARLWSMIFGVGTIVLTYMLGKKLYGKTVGVIGAFILLTTPHVIQYSRMGHMDIPLTFFITLSILLFLYAQEGRINHIWIGIAIGCAIMIKGVAGILPFFIMGLYSLLSGDFKQIINKKLFIITGGTLLIVAPWHLTQVFLHGTKFINAYLIQQVFKRVSTTLAEHFGTEMYYVMILRDGFWPYFIFLPFAVLWILIDFIKHRKKNDTLIFSWMVVVFLIFTISKTKLPWYIIPIYPALSISVAKFFDCFLNAKGSEEDVLCHVGMYILFGIFLGSSIIPKVLHHFSNKFTVGFMITTFLYLVDIVFLQKKLMISFLSHKDSRDILSEGLRIGLILIILGTAFNLPPQYDITRDIKGIFEYAQTLSLYNSSNVVYEYNLSQYFPSILFYANKKIQEIQDRSQLSAILNTNTSLFLILPPWDYIKIQNKSHIVIIGSWDKVLVCVNCNLSLNSSSYLLIHGTDIKYSIRHPVIINFDNKILFLGYNMSKVYTKGGVIFIDITYVWKCIGSPDKDYKVAVHFIRDKQIVFQQDHEFAYGLYPLSKCKTNEIVIERYIIPVPKNVQSGEYQILIGLYTSTGDSLKAINLNNKKLVPIGSIRI